MKKSFKAITTELRSFIVSNFELTSSYKGQDEVEIDISTEDGDFSMYIENYKGLITVETVIMCCESTETIRDRIIEAHRKLKELCNGSFFRFEFDII